MEVPKDWAGWTGVEMPETGRFSYNPPEEKKLQIVGC